jgi:predicted alpha/beta hydrolase family esterase
MQLHAFLSQQGEGSPSLETSLAEASVLVVPGWNGSGVGHWQTMWEQKYPGFRRIEQHSWSRPSRTDWVAQIDADIDRHNIDGGKTDRVASPTFLVAHSLGCLAVAHWAAGAGKKTDHVDGAFLVAPPWLTPSDQCPAQLADFLPMPLARLPFPSLFVASENDPYLPIEIAGRLAAAWGSQFVDIGRQGHINVASGHGPWPIGEGLLRGFVARTVARF